MTCFISIKKMTKAKQSDYFYIKNQTRKNRKNIYRKSKFDVDICYLINLKYHDCSVDKLMAKTFVAVRIDI